jgi:hypothetical protein
MTRDKAITNIIMIVMSVQNLDITPVAGINGISLVLDQIDEEGS